MKSIRSFIVHTDQAFKDSYTTESGLVVYADKRMSAQRLSNRVVKVVEIPAAMKNCEIQPGFEVMVDPTIFFMQNYDGRGDQDNPYMIDRHKGLYKVEPGMVVLYRENESNDWKPYGRNMMVEIITTTTEKKIGELVIGTEKKETVKALYPSAEMEREGVVSGSEISIQKGYEVPFWIEGKECFWIDSRHVLAKLN